MFAVLLIFLNVYLLVSCFCLFRSPVLVYRYLKRSRKGRMGVTTVIKDYGTEILNAIRENDLQRLKNILEKQLKFDRKIQKLCVADIKHKPTKKFACPVILAARQEDPRIMKYMMDKGVDPNFIHHTIFSSKRREIVTALHISVDLGHYDTVQVLCDANADCNIGDHNQETPLHISVKKADRIMTRLLLSKGADPSIPDRRGNAALHIATLYGHLQLVRSLLKYSADVYQKGQWNTIPPHIAAKEGHIHLIQLFCSRDVGNINIKIPCYADKREKAPIHLAGENGHVETVLALLDQFDAEVNLKDSDGNTPLHCVVLNQYSPHRMRDKEYFNETAKVLIKFGVAINEKNIYGDTALHLAAMNQFQRIVEMLLEVGANPFVENEEHLKPIDVVPDFDPVTKQVLKNGMLNPRPVLSNSRSILNSQSTLHSLRSSQSQNSIIRKPHSHHSNGTRSSSSGTPDKMEKSRSLHSFPSQSTMSIGSSVFDDNMRGKIIMTPPEARDDKYDRHHERHQQQQQQHQHHQQQQQHQQQQKPGPKWGKGREKERDMEEVHNQINQEKDLYSKVDKRSKRSKQQTDTRRIQTTAKQHDEDYDDDYSMQDDSSQVMKPTGNVMTPELKHILQKQKHDMQRYEMESVTDQSSVIGPDPTYMSKEGKPDRYSDKPRPSPRMPRQSTKASLTSDKLQYIEEDSQSTIYYDDNESQTSEKPVPRKPRRKASDASQTSQQQDDTISLSNMPAQVQGMIAQQLQGEIQGGIRLNAIPGKPGMIEVQYGGYGGTPITIQFDTSSSQYSVQQGDKPFEAMMQQQQQQQQQQQEYPTEQYNVKEHYQQQEGDDNGQYSESFSTSTPQGSTEPYQGPFRDASYLQDLNASADSTEMETSQFSTMSTDTQPEAVKNAIKQTVLEITETGKSEGTPQSPAKPKKKPRQKVPQPQPRQNVQAQDVDTEQFEQYQQQLQQQYQKKQKQIMQKELLQQKLQEQQQQRQGKQQSQPVPQKPMQYARADESYVPEEEEAEVSPDTTPNASPKYKSFSQAMAFAKKQEDEYLSQSPSQSPAMRRKVQKATTQKPSGDSTIVATPEASRWKVMPGDNAAAVVESSEGSPLIRKGYTAKQDRPQSAYMDSGLLTAQSGSDQQGSDADSSSEASSSDEEQEEPSKLTAQQTAQQSHDLYYSITPSMDDQGSQGSGSARGTPTLPILASSSRHGSRVSSQKPQHVAPVDQFAYQVSNEQDPSSESVNAQSVKQAAAESKLQVEIPETGNQDKLPDELIEYDAEPGSHREHYLISPLSPSLEDQRSTGSKTPDSILSDGSGRGLKMRVTGEVPKAYNRMQKPSARKAFIRHYPPVRIESCSESSDNEHYLNQTSPPGSTRAKFEEAPQPVYDKNTPLMDIKPLVAPKPVKLIGQVPSHYKSFGKIDPKIDALLEALEEQSIHSDLEQELEDLEKSEVPTPKTEACENVSILSSASEGVPKKLISSSSSEPTSPEEKKPASHGHSPESEVTVLEKDILLSDRLPSETTDPEDEAGMLEGFPARPKPKKKPRPKLDLNKVAAAAAVAEAKAAKAALHRKSPGIKSPAPLTQFTIPEEDLEDDLEEDVFGSDSIGPSAESGTENGSKDSEPISESFETSDLKAKKKPKKKPRPKKTVTVTEERTNESGEIETITTTRVVGAMSPPLVTAEIVDTRTNNSDREAKPETVIDSQTGDETNTTILREKSGRKGRSDRKVNEDIQAIDKQECGGASSSDEQSKVVSVIEVVRMTEKKKIVPIDTLLPSPRDKAAPIRLGDEPEDDEVAQISAAAEEKKKKKRKTKKKAKAAAEATGVVKATGAVAVVSMETQSQHRQANSGSNEPMQQNGQPQPPTYHQVQQQQQQEKTLQADMKAQIWAEQHGVQRQEPLPDMDAAEQARLQEQALLVAQQIAPGLGRKQQQQLYTTAAQHQQQQSTPQGYGQMQQPYSAVVQQQQQQQGFEGGGGQMLPTKFLTSKESVHDQSFDSDGKPKKKGLLSFGKKKKKDKSPKDGEATTQEKPEKKSRWGTSKKKDATSPEAKTLTIELNTGAQQQHLSPTSPKSDASETSSLGSPTTPEGILGTVFGAPSGSKLERSDTLKENPTSTGGNEKRKAGFFSLGSKRGKKDKKNQEEEFGAVPYVPSPSEQMMEQIAHNHSPDDLLSQQTNQQYLDPTTAYQHPTSQQRASQQASMQVTPQSISEQRTVGHQGPQPQGQEKPTETNIDDAYDVLYEEQQKALQQHVQQQRQQHFQYESQQEQHQKQKIRPSVETNIDDITERGPSMETNLDDFMETHQAAPSNTQDQDFQNADFAAVTATLPQQLQQMGSDQRYAQAQQGQGPSSQMQQAHGQTPANQMLPGQAFQSSAYQKDQVPQNQMHRGRYGQSQPSQLTSGAAYQSQPGSQPTSSKRKSSDADVMAQMWAQQNPAPVPQQIPTGDNKLKKKKGKKKKKRQGSMDAPAPHLHMQTSFEDAAFASITANLNQQQGQRQGDPYQRPLEEPPHPPQSGQPHQKYASDKEPQALIGPDQQYPLYQHPQQNQHQHSQHPEQSNAQVEEELDKMWQQYNKQQAQMTQEVSSLWKEHTDHEADMQRVLASMSDPEVMATEGDESFGYYGDISTDQVYPVSESQDPHHVQPGRQPSYQMGEAEESVTPKKRWGTSNISKQQQEQQKQYENQQRQQQEQQQEQLRKKMALEGRTVDEGSPAPRRKVPKQGSGTAESGTELQDVALAAMSQSLQEQQLQQQQQAIQQQQEMEVVAQKAQIISVDSKLVKPQPIYASPKRKLRQPKQQEQNEAAVQMWADQYPPIKTDLSKAEVVVMQPEGEHQVQPDDEQPGHFQRRTGARSAIRAKKKKKVPVGGGTYKTITNMSLLWMLILLILSNTQIEKSVKSINIHKLFNQIFVLRKVTLSQGVYSENILSNKCIVI